MYKVHLSSRDEVVNIVTSTGWVLHYLNPGGGEIFHSHPEVVPRYTQPPVKWVLVPFLVAKQLGHTINHPPPSSAKVKERVDLYLYTLS